MADANDVEFENRLKRINRRHRQAARGYVQLVERNGILIPVATRRARRRGFPAVGLLMTVAGFLAFKGFLYAWLGPLTYADRVSELAQGNVAERVGGWMMAADPVTQWIAGQMLSLVSLLS